MPIPPLPFASYWTTRHSPFSVDPVSGKSVWNERHALVRSSTPRALIDVEADDCRDAFATRKEKTPRHGPSPVGVLAACCSFMLPRSNPSHASCSLCREPGEPGDNRRPAVFEVSDRADFLTRRPCPYRRPARVPRGDIGMRRTEGCGCGFMTIRSRLPEVVHLYLKTKETDSKEKTFCSVSVVAAELAQCWTAPCMYGFVCCGAGNRT